MKKRIFNVILSLAMLLSTATIVSATDGDAIRIGDVNGDGFITATDARMALRFSARLDEPTKEQKTAADANGDGEITAADARMALRFSARLDEPTKEQKTAADANGDGNITAADARKILRWSARLDPLLSWVMEAQETKLPTELPTQPPSDTTNTAPETFTPETSEINQSTFDVNGYVQYAIDYGQSIGLIYHPEVFESWDNPIDAGADVSDDYLKEAIRNRLNRYKNVEGFEYFNVWAEPGINSEYRIVIAYS